MKKIIFLVVILLIPVCAGAAYTIYLKNGSVISDVRSYNEKGEEISVYFQTGAMVIPKSDILRITGEETREKTVPEEAQEPQGSQENSDKQIPAAGRREIREGQEQSAGSPAPEEPGADRNARIREVKSELDSVYAEIRTVEADEAKLVKEINQKRSSRFNYNKYQMNQLIQETEPLQQELFTVQQKKEELRQRKDALENELRSLQ
jgi:chromosome segregation ATPase